MCHMNACMFDLLNWCGKLVVNSSAMQFGTRAFTVVGPKAWNQLPAHLQALQTVGPFKTALETYLHSMQWLSQIACYATPRSCYGALEIVGAITITIITYSLSHTHSKVNSSRKHTVMLVYFVTARMWSRVWIASSRVGVRISAYSGGDDDDDSGSVSSIINNKLHCQGWKKT